MNYKKSQSRTERAIIEVKLIEAMDRRKFNLFVIFIFNKLMMTPLANSVLIPSLSGGRVDSSRIHQLVRVS